MKRRKVNKYAIQYAVLFSAFSLALHFITVYLLCHGTGLLLAGGDMLNSPEKWEMREKAETIMGQAGMLGNLFIASCYLFVIITGIFILERLIDTHGMTELCNWLWAVLHQKAVWILLTLPLLISAGRYIVRMAGQKKEQ